MQSMPGASGRRMMGYMQNIAPKDGTVDRRAAARAAFDPLTEPDSQFDAQAFRWLGSANDEVNVCIVWHATPFQTIEDVYKREIVVGSSGPTSTDSVYPNVINNLFGTKFKVVTGYKGAAEDQHRDRARRSRRPLRHELGHPCGAEPGLDQGKEGPQRWSRSRLEKHPELADVPSVFDLAKNEEQRQILSFWAAPNKMGRPFYAPAELPKDRAELLRRSFDRALKDPASTGGGGQDQSVCVFDHRRGGSRADRKDLQARRSRSLPRQSKPARA